MIPFEWIGSAAIKITPYINETPITYDEEFDLYIKWENHQVTGSFKARGAFNKILNLEPWERESGILAASAGNHGQGVALAAQKTGAPARIFAPDNAPEIIISAMRQMGAEVLLIPGGYTAAEHAALDEAEKGEATWVSPYNDGQLIAGQATLGLEALRQLEAFQDFSAKDSVWFVPVSGGGLLAGVATALQTSAEIPEIVGVQAQAHPFMQALFSGIDQDNFDELPTLADGLAGKIEPGSITVPIIRELADEIILVDEDEIRRTVKLAWQRYGERIEGAGAVSLAAAIARNRKGPAIAVISGGNIDAGLHYEIISEAE